MQGLNLSKPQSWHWPARLPLLKDSTNESQNCQCSFSQSPPFRNRPGQPFVQLTGRTARPSGVDGAIEGLIVVNLNGERCRGANLLAQLTASTLPPPQTCLRVPRGFCMMPENFSGY
jgi:hypothetical protein